MTLREFIANMYAAGANDSSKIEFGAMFPGGVFESQWGELSVSEITFSEDHNEVDIEIDIGELNSACQLVARKNLRDKILPIIDCGDIPGENELNGIVYKIKE